MTKTAVFFNIKTAKNTSVKTSVKRSMVFLFDYFSKTAKIGL